MINGRDRERGTGAQTCGGSAEREGRREEDETRRTSAGHERAALETKSLEHTMLSLGVTLARRPRRSLARFTRSTSKSGPFRVLRQPLQALFVKARFVGTKKRGAELSIALGIFHAFERLLREIRAAGLVSGFIGLDGRLLFIIRRRHGCYSATVRARGVSRGLGACLAVLAGATSRPVVGTISGARHMTWSTWWSVVFLRWDTDARHLHISANSINRNQPKTDRKNNNQASKRSPVSPPALAIDPGYLRFVYRAPLALGEVPAQCQRWEPLTRPLARRRCVRR